MSTAIGVNSQLRFKRQTAKGTLAGASLGQILRRESAIFELKKETYTTESEITSTQQLLSNRHGVRSVDGKIAGILSPGTYSDMISAVLRKDFTAVTALTAVGITIGAVSSGIYPITRSAGSWFTDGIKVGQVIRISVGGMNAANLNKNILITSITGATTAFGMPVNGVALVPEGPITGNTITVIGKVAYTPITGHTNVYYTVEVWDPDVPASERNQDCKVGTVGLSLPGSGNAKINISMLGLDQSASSSVYYTSPTVETSTGALVAASGLLLAGGASIATVTDLSLNIDGKEQLADAVVGDRKSVV